MEPIRKPFQGVFNIIRFNWHFYALALCLVLSLVFIASHSEMHLRFLLYVSAMLIAVAVLVSLSVSFYIYDLSGLYRFHWLEGQRAASVIVNINAGFDETSALLKGKFSHAALKVIDFYDPIKHTEISIERARKAYPSHPGTRQVDTSDLKLASRSVDMLFVIFSAHEIRDEDERILFFRELERVIKPNGQIFIVEHLRDFPNFLAYNIGFFHFYAKKSWLKTFNSARLNMQKEIKLTPFISIFVLGKNGDTR